MSEKQKLIDSMINLIHHISQNPSKREEIFSTLSAEDLNKMLANLEDDNEIVRKTTLSLLAEFLFENSRTQNKFCQMTGTAQFEGKVVLTSKFPRNVLNEKVVLKEIFDIMKQSSNLEHRGLFWFIDCRLKSKIMLLGRRNTQSVDPLHCIVGVWVQGKPKQEKKEETVPWKSVSYVEKTPNSLKVKMTESRNYEKYFGSEFIPQISTKSSLTDESVMAKSLNTNNYAQYYTTPIRPKSNLAVSSKTEPISTLASNLHPPASMQTLTTLKIPYTPVSYHVNYVYSPITFSQKVSSVKAQTDRKASFQPYSLPIRRI